jgi:hypothetical protein
MLPEIESAVRERLNGETDGVTVDFWVSLYIVAAYVILNGQVLFDHTLIMDQTIGRN